MLAADSELDVRPGLAPLLDRGTNQLSDTGDIVFFSKTGRAEDIHHDALYIGGGLMVEAPFTGALVRINTGDRPDYFGAARLF